MSPAVPIHGEFEANNILYVDGQVQPIDWESAAFAVGEIDLASLTWGWAGDIVAHCEQTYRETRWPDGAPADFVPRLAACRLHLHFRWLGDRPAWTDPLSSPVSYNDLQSLGEQCELI